ncbi:MAG: aldose 1-epimerase family protein [Clostridia bacterium]|nr:aldose 1-epimerase family protein [Clostridia bacterium]
MNKRIFSSQLNVDIDTKGAELLSIKNKMNNTEYLWQGDEKIWSKHAPVLFPVVGKLKNFSYSYNDEDYVLMQHGFAKDLEFKVTSEKDNELCLLLESNDITMEYYPFKFALLARYQVKDNFLVAEYVVTNLNNKIMPFSIGVHPGFKCPIDENLAYEDYYLEFSNEEEFNQIELDGGIGKDQRKKLTAPGKELKVNRDLFSGDAIVLDKPNSTAVRLKSDLSNKCLTIAFNKVPYLGLWSKPLRNSYVCIEPWFGMSDFESSNGKIEDKEGIQKLLPYQVFTFSYTLKME